MENVNNQTLLIAFVALTGAAVLLQAIVLFVLYLTVRKAANGVREELEELRGAITPVLKESREFLARVGPKIEATATDVAQVTHLIREQSAEIHSSATEILERLKRQSSRVDSMVSGTLDTVDRAGGVITDMINVPLRQISAIAAFLKAAVRSLQSNGPRPTVNGVRQQSTHSPADKDLFV